MPILYQTTTSLLEVLGLNDISELPQLTHFAPDAETAARIEEQLTSSFGGERVPEDESICIKPVQE